MTVGDVLDGKDGEKFAQPRIEYRIRAIMKLMSLDGHSITDAWADKEVAISPYTEPSPPIDINDFPEDFVNSATHSFRSSYLGSTYQMTVSMPEPTPMSTTSTKLSRKTTLRFHVKIQLTTCRRDRGLHSLCNILKDLRFHTQLALRTKTFFSIRPFSQMPGYTMTGSDYSLDVHESVFQIQTVDVASNSWQLHFHSDTPQREDLQHLALASPFGSSSQPPRENTVNNLSSGQADAIAPSTDGWTTVFDVPLHIEEALTPTFCSAIASRQYSLVARIKVKGGPSKEFRLEVPLQNHYGPRSEASNSAGESRAAIGNQFENARRLRSGDRQLSDLWNDDAVRVHLKCCAL
jgi:hypothetical protein